MLLLSVSIGRHSADGQIEKQIRCFVLFFFGDISPKNWPEKVHVVVAAHKHHIQFFFFFSFFIF